MIAEKILQNAGLKKKEKLVLIFDNTSPGKEFIKAANKIGCTLFFCNIDMYKRPLQKIPPEIKKEVLNADLLIMLLEKKSSISFDEHKTFRKPVIDLKEKNKKLRVGSLLSTPSNIYKEIFSYNSKKIHDLNKKILSLLKKNRQIKIITPAGTNLEIDNDPKYTWINQNADLTKPSMQHSLLAGEVYGYPAKVNGTFVIDGVLGGKFSKYNVSKQPLHITLKNSTVQKIKSENKTLEKEFRLLLEKNPCAKKIGELGFGTNIALKKFYEILGVDEKYPGNHLAFGDPYGKRTGAKWKCDIHIDGVMKNCSTWIGKTQVLKKGKYIL